MPRTAAGTSLSFRIQRVQGSYPLRERQLLRIDVHGNDVPVAFGSEYLNQQKADHPRTDNHRCVIGHRRMTTDRVHGDRYGFEERGALERQAVGQL